MIDFPTATKVHRRLPKEAFYKRLPLTKVLKDKFVSDVDRIVVENSLTKENLNLNEDSDIKEILLLSIILKKQEFDGKVIEAIARQNPHKLVFLLSHEDRRQLALYHGKLYRTQWMDETEVDLKPQGFSLGEIWDAFTEQIALYEERAEKTDALSVDERLKLQEEIVKLEKLIQKTEAAAWKEQQPKKQFELYSRLREYKKRLDGLKNGII
ncbi:DUF4391 domain-containing protein [uncultured Dysosmobacter sp.]|uniref:DUF4391 domain-containing protein n=1 Tax=uncultured Dysosmobacter sp. TaxID=2591384 RepID=UPI002637BEF7|nr:DUF4391 domain-containing protein [uncultured Dysosmobacter sp.]